MGGRSVSYIVQIHVRHTLGVEPYEVGGRFTLESFSICSVIGLYFFFGVGIGGYCYFDTSGEWDPIFY